MRLDLLHNALMQVAEKLSTPADRLMCVPKNGALEVYSDCMAPHEQLRWPIAIICRRSDTDDLVEITWVHDHMNITFERSCVV